MANYLIKHTDPANGSFLVPDNQIDGTQAPWSAALYVNPVSSVTALSSNSSIVIPGRGITDYGELLANGVIQAMEHFAYKSRPLTPAQGQIWYKNANYVDPSFPTDPTLAGLYVWSGTAWGPILAAVGGIVNMAGARITNLGNAIAATDALNQQTGDIRYVLKAGDTMTGLLVLSGDPVAALGAATKQYVDNTTVSLAGDTMTGLLVLSGDPVTALGAATKQYVDNTSVSITGDTMTGLLVLSADPVAALGAATKQYVDNTTVSITGDTMSGSLIIDTNASLLLAPPGTGTFDGGTRRLQNIGTPTANQDAATKLYVDLAVAGVIIPPGVDTYVTSGSFNPLTGQLDLTRNDAVVITVAGNMAPFVHSHTTSSITFDLSPNYGQSLIRATEQQNPAYPLIPVYNVLKTFDQTITDISRHVRRKLLTGDGTTSSFDLNAVGPYMTYAAGENKLQVFVDGVKQYANERGRSTIVYQNSPISLDTPVGLTINTPYLFDITVDGTPYLNVSLTPRTTAINLLNLTSGGTLYTTGTYFNVPLTGGTGTGATADITVFGGSVTSVDLVIRGNGYTVSDVLSAASANIGGTGSGFTATVAMLSGTYTFYDLLVDVSARFRALGIPATISLDQYFETLLFDIESNYTGIDVAIGTLGAITGGTLYTNGSYLNVPLTGGAGTGARANITVSGGSVTVVTLTNHGHGYLVGDILSALAANIGGTGSGFQVPVATLIGSSVTISNAVGELFRFPAPSVPFQVAAPDNNAVTQTLSYRESFAGADVPASRSVSEITFTTPPALGTVIEVLLFPG